MKFRCCYSLSNSGSGSRFRSRNLKSGTGPSNLLLDSMLGFFPPAPCLVLGLGSYFPWFFAFINLSTHPSTHLPIHFPPSLPLTLPPTNLLLPPNHSRLKRLTVWLPTGICYAFFYCTRYNVAAGNVESVRSDLNFSADYFATVVTAGFWTYAVSAPVTGIVSDKMGGR